MEKRDPLNTTVNDSPSQKLMVNGFVQPDKESLHPVEIKRDMTVLTQDGQTAGQIAAVVVNQPGQTVTHILLGYMRPALEYRLVPISLIKQAVNDEVILSINYSAIQKLPRRNETKY